MILGLGIDIVDIERIKKKVSKGDHFKKMVFSPNEILYCEKKPTLLKAMLLGLPAKKPL